jgi:hypothetical protein
MEVVGKQSSNALNVVSGEDSSSPIALQDGVFSPNGYVSANKFYDMGAPFIAY